MKLHIIRHAEPDYINDTITAKGRREAELLAEKLKKYDLTHIFCSPLGRAQATMKYCADITGISPVTEEWTRELTHPRIDTPYGNLMIWDVPGEVYLQELNPNFSQWKKNEYYPDRTEIDHAYDKISQNSDKFFAHFGYIKEGSIFNIESPSKAQIAVFCHNGFGLTWFSYLLNIPYTVAWSGFWMPPSSITTIIFEERSEIYAVPRCIAFADISHLYKADEEISYCGLKGNRI